MALPRRDEATVMPTPDGGRADFRTQAYVVAGVTNLIVLTLVALLAAGALAGELLTGEKAASGYMVALMAVYAFSLTLGPWPNWSRRPKASLTNDLPWVYRIDVSWLMLAMRLASLICLLAVILSALRWWVF